MKDITPESITVISKEHYIDTESNKHIRNINSILSTNWKYDTKYKEYTVYLYNISDDIYNRIYTHFEKLGWYIVCECDYYGEIISIRFYKTKPPKSEIISKWRRFKHLLKRMFYNQLSSIEDND